MTPKEVRERTNDFRQMSKAFADRVDAIAEEVTHARRRLGKKFRRVEEALDEADRNAAEPNERVAAAFDELAAEAKKSFERVVTRKRPRRFWFW